MVLIRGFVDLVYPPRCYVCGQASQKPLCDACLAKIELIKSSPLCERCGKPLLESASNCHTCRGRRLYFSHVRAIGLYDGVLKEAIHALKFGGGRRLGYFFAQLMAESLPDDFIQVDVVTFVPLHRRKRRNRGYNQAELLAKAFGRRTGKPVKQLLKCRRRTKDQTKLSLKDRRANVREAFRLLSKSTSWQENLRDKRIILIDDVYTSGSTVNECAWVLRRAGAKEVKVFTLARTILE